ncbi:MAG TPA: hypothetical protein VGX92_07895 [Pyrinomonadaceae bacterium]|jgi:DNA-binding transcriptional MerR regulator|nr:hypothetical protein [Pyrinomonadaceae bacterium]
MQYPTNNKELRRSFTTVFLGIIALASLLIGRCIDDPNIVETTGLLLITLISLLLMVFLHIEDLKDLGFKNVNNVTGTTDITISTFKGEHQTIKTMIGVLPESNGRRERSTDEKILSLELKQILNLDNGLTLPNCEKALDLLKEHEAIVNASWTHTLNKARLLAITEQLEEAERLASEVITKFSHSTRAIGTAYEVLSFIEEFGQPKEKGLPYQQWLNRRRYFVMQGLKFFPTGHDLLMNAFEIATLESNVIEVLTYLGKAVRVDRERTRKNLSINPLTQTATELAPEIKETIKDLMEGDNKMKFFEMIKVKALILALTMMLALTSSLYSQTNQFTKGSVSARGYIIFLYEQAHSFCQGSPVAGTSFGNAFTSFRRIGTGFGSG